ncbi:hypothetical protein [uncultured Cohaesibacter sp.]|uniref:hypothetical protein n=1 Tax=uncultured Cohaesibacter sp. TaxID=1002546 RepID=UPI0029C93332|nr:hypothetical protein [uncultured Cohaesibacter sp.]
MAGSRNGFGWAALKTVGLASVPLLLTTMIASAQTVAINTRVKAISDTGTVELTLPKDSMVAIGDKVQFKVDLSAPAVAEKPALEWRVIALKDGVIIVEPSAEPQAMPKPGYSATINTYANQPTLVTASEARIKAAEMNAAEAVSSDASSAEASEPVTTEPETSAPITASEASVPVAPVESSTGEAETSEPPAKAELPDTASATASTAKSEDEETTEAAEPKEKTEPEAEAEPAKLVEAAPTGADAEAQKPTAEKEPTQAKEAAEAKEPDAGQKDLAADKPVAPSPDMVPASDAAPAPEMECDRLAAHPFDPDAVTKGVYYEDLDAEKIIAACQDAITAYPHESRFYTQLTRGQYKAGKPSLALAATRRGVELGSGQSMAYLGVLYKNGEMVGKSQPEALSWFEKAAQKGNPGGMLFAAAMYRDGVGTTRNYKRAAELYKMASDMEVAEAASDLGIFYDRGQGVARDPQKAADLLLKAYLADDADTRQLFFEAPGVISEETRKAIQTRLKDAGFYKSVIDADFGSGTRRALMLYKKSKKN